MLLQALNPASPIKGDANGDDTFREGSVTEIRNNYDILWKKEDGTAAGAGIFNGDVGVVKVNRPQQTMVP